MIHLTEVEFRFDEGDFALHIPELVVEPGATVAVVGPSGSGKTTLLNLVAGIAAPQAGRIETRGVDLTELDDSQRRDFRIRNIGLVFQEFELLEYLSVLDNILLPYRINPALRLTPDVRRRAAALATGVGVADKLGRKAEHLSHGEKQRAAVCRALIAEPGLLLADEPTGNLDPANVDRVLEILFESVRASGATLLTVTHDREILGRFDRVIDFTAFQSGGAAT